MAEGAGLKAIYLSGWQVAADGEPRGGRLSRPEPLSGEQRPGDGAAAEQRAPARRPDRMGRGQARRVDYLLPIVADAEAGFGGPLNAFELMKGDDRGGRGGRPLRGPARRRRRSAATSAARCSCRPASSSARCSAARLAADVLGVPTRAGRAHRRLTRATLLTSDADERDARVPHRRAHARGLLPRPRRASRPAIARGLAYAPYADLVWMRDVDAGPRRGARVRRGDPRRVPGQAARLQLLAVVQLAAAPRRRRRSRASSASSARWATSSSSSRSRASTRSTSRCSSSRAATRPRGCPPTSELQEREFALEARGYTATRHQREVGAGWFDEIAQAVSGGAQLDARAQGLDRGGAVPTATASSAH